MAKETNMKDTKIYKVSFIPYGGKEEFSSFFSKEEEAKKHAVIYVACEHKGVCISQVWASQLARTIKIDSGIAVRTTFYCSKKGRWLYGSTSK
jgi:hypothetical protein